MMIISSWPVWKVEIVTARRHVHHELFADLQQEDIDWEAWKPLYEFGYEPDAAIAQAISVNADTL